MSFRVALEQAVNELTPQERTELAQHGHTMRRTEDDIAAMKQEVRRLRRLRLAILTEGRRRFWRKHRRGDA